MQAIGGKLIEHGQHVDEGGEDLPAVHNHRRRRSASRPMGHSPRTHRGAVKILVAVADLDAIVIGASDTVCLSSGHRTASWG